MTNLKERGPLAVVFFGVSGSGKGTQAKLLEEYLRTNDPSPGILRPEMGTLIRSFMKQGTPFADCARHIHDSGDLVPSFVPIYLLTGFMNEHFSGSEHVIFDGTCRRPDQSRAVNDMMRLWDRTELHAIILELSPKNVQKRLTLRGRQDDTDAAIQNRIAYYKEHVIPSYEELEKLGWNMLHINGEPGIETIHKNILSVLQLA